MQLTTIQTELLKGWSKFMLLLAVSAIGISKWIMITVVMINAPSVTNLTAFIFTVPFVVIVSAAVCFFVVWGNSLYDATMQ